MPAPTVAPAPSEATRRVARNIASPFAAQLLVRAITTASYILMVRLLGGPGQSDELSQYIIAGVILSYANTIADWGLGTWLTRELAAHRGDGESTHGARTRFAETLAVRLALAGAAMLLLAAFSLLAPRFRLLGLSPAGAVATLVLGLSLLPGAFSSAVTALYNAYERMALPAGVQVASALLNLVLGVVVLLLGWGAPGLAGAALLTTAGTAALFYRLLRRDFFAPALRWDGRAGRVMLRAAFPLMLNSLLITIFFRFDVLIIGQVRAADVQVYETAYKVINVTQIIAPSVVLALFPAMARAALHDRAALVRQYRLAVKLLLVLALPLVVATVALATPLITIITLGKGGYLPYSAWALAILIGYLPFSLVNGVTTYVLIAVHRQGRLTWAIGGTALFNIAGNLLAVPAFGIYGAAVMTVLSELVLLVPFLVWARGELGPAALRPGRAGVRLGLAGGALSLTAAGLAALGLGGLVAAIGGCVVYSLALGLLGVFSPGEWARLRGLLRLPGRPRGAGAVGR